MIPRKNPPSQASVAYLTPKEASALCGLSPDHLARMTDRGDLSEIRPGGSHRRYLRAEVEALAQPITKRVGA